MAELARVPAGTLTRRTPAAIAAKALAPATSLPRVAMAQAGGESSLTLHFRDGELGVVPADAAAPPRPAPRRVSRGEAPGQEDLFG